MGRESDRDQFIWYGLYDSAEKYWEQYSVGYGDDETKYKTFYKSYTYLPAGYPMRRYWMGRDQFQVSYNLNQLDLAGLLRVRYFHAEEEWNTEPPVSMYLTPKGADFIVLYQVHPKVGGSQDSSTETHRQQEIMVSKASFTRRKNLQGRQRRSR